MIKSYQTEDLIPLSGIQHFCFCRRQWALIHVERQWQENSLTAEGRCMHQRVDDPDFSEMRKGVIISRSMPVASYELGLVGVCDVVEFYPSPDGIALPGREGLFQPAPVEYKRGKKKQDHSDDVQLCAQVMCLEEMLSTHISKGYFFYGETRHRVELEISTELRCFVRQISDEMHAYLSRGYTPKVKPSKGCRNCSLNEICLPDLQAGGMAASRYIKQRIEEE